MSNLHTISHSKYKMLQSLGEGCFARVAKCENQVTKELVALKVMKKKKNVDYVFRAELNMLHRINQLDPDTFNLIKFIEHFEYAGRPCMAFQILDRSVEAQMKKQSQFSLSEIRPMTKQLLVALLGLKTIGVMHTDIKSDNIMLVDQEKQPFKVRLIDFGVAMESIKVNQGTVMQPMAFRSPEVVLGLPLCEAVDMWSLACCLLFWYWKDKGFRCYSRFDQITRLVSFLGTPGEEILNEGLFIHKYFVKENSKWRLKTVHEYFETTGENPQMSASHELPCHLEEIIKDHNVFETGPELKDREAFCDLLKKMFVLDPHKRITPVEALLHPFITMEHLPHGDGYSQAAEDLMHVAETDYFLLQRQNLERVVQSKQEERAKILATKVAEATPCSCSLDLYQGAEITSSAEKTVHSPESANQESGDDNRRATIQAPLTPANVEETETAETILQEEGASRWSRLIPRPLQRLWSTLFNSITDKPVGQNAKMFKKKVHSERAI